MMHQGTSRWQGVVEEVIEISSSEDEDGDLDPVMQNTCADTTQASSSSNRRYFAGRVHGRANVPAMAGQSSRDQNNPPTKRGRARRVVYSSSEDEQSVHAATKSDADVIELTDSSDSEIDHPPSLRPPSNIPAALPLFLDDSSSETDDGAILTLDEPKSARRPISRRPDGSSKEGATVSVKVTLALRPSSSINEVQGGPAFSAVLSTPRTPRRAGAPAKTPRTSKKALALALQAQRAEYAQKLFDELNRSVFGEGLPLETRLTWSNRLLTTAGRARWHRSKDGVHTTEIELATKVLDSNERIRNTLSHEMCHLACWIINKDPKEGHGKAFKAWADKVTRRRPEIEITTRHDYEISYPYEWECGNCAKIYGRFSKSIRPDEVVCGACKTGRLEPLFSVRARATGNPKTPKTKAGSNLASSTPRDSPRSVGQSGESGMEVLLATVRRLRLEDDD